ERTMLTRIRSRRVGDEYVLVFSMALRTDGLGFTTVFAERPHTRTVIRHLIAPFDKQPAFLQAPEALELRDDQMRRQSTNFGNFTADLIRGELNTRDRTRLKADIGLVNSGSFRLDRNLVQGEPIKAKTLCDVFFHPNRLLLGEQQGEKIREILLKSWE